MAGQGTGQVKVDVATEWLDLPTYIINYYYYFFLALNSSKTFETADLNFECDSNVLEVMRTDTLMLQGDIMEKKRREGDFSPEVAGLQRNLSMSNPAEESSQRNIYQVAFRLDLI